MGELAGSRTVQIRTAAGRLIRQNLFSVRAAGETGACGRAAPKPNAAPLFACPLTLLAGTVCAAHGPASPAAKGRQAVQAVTGSDRRGQPRRDLPHSRLPTEPSQAARRKPQPDPAHSLAGHGAVGGAHEAVGPKHIGTLAALAILLLGAGEEGKGGAVHGAGPAQEPAQLRLACTNGGMGSQGTV